MKLQLVMFYVSIYLKHFLGNILYINIFNRNTWAAVGIQNFSNFAMIYIRTVYSELVFKGLLVQYYGKYFLFWFLMQVIGKFDALFDNTKSQNK